MGNLLQKILYNLSIFSPSLFTFAIAYHKFHNSNLITSLIILLSILLACGVIVQILFLSKNANVIKLTPKSIKIEKPITHLQLIHI